MKKHLTAALILAGALIALPTVARAQFTSPYIYNNNAYLNYALAHSKARRARAAAEARRRGKVARKKNSSRRRAVRRTRRVSQLNLMEFRRGLNVINSKAVEIT